MHHTNIHNQKLNSIEILLFRDTKNLVVLIIFRLLILHNGSAKKYQQIIQHINGKKYN